MCSIRGKKLQHTKLWSEISRENHLEDLGVDGRIILEYILDKQDAKMCDCYTLVP
jgi:hypothetical protein